MEQQEPIIAQALRGLIKTETARRNRLRARMAQGNVAHGKPQRRRRALKECEELIAEASALLLRLPGTLQAYYGNGVSAEKGHAMLSRVMREHVDTHGAGVGEIQLIETLGLDVPELGAGA